MPSLANVLQVIKNPKRYILFGQMCFKIKITWESGPRFALLLLVIFSYGQVQMYMYPFRYAAE